MVGSFKYLLLALFLSGALLCVVATLRSAATAKAAQTPGLFDRWNETLGYAILTLALIGAAWLVARTHWGADLLWTGESWVRSSLAFPPSAGIEVSESRESWKANIFYGCALGLVFGLSALFADGKWSAAKAFWVALGFGFFLWMIQSAVENYTRTVRLTAAGLEEHSLFGTRRIPWSEIGGLEYRDVQAQIQKLQDWKTRRTANVPHIDVWEVQDSQGREILTLHDGMKPEDDFRKLREQLKQRSTPR